MFLAADIDVAQVITALAGLVTALGWALAQLRNHGSIKQVQQSIGPTNGVDLSGLVAQVKELDGYTHDEIHKLRDMLAPVAALAPHDPELLNTAVANKVAERNEQASTGGRRSDDPPAPDTSPVTG